MWLCVRQFVKNLVWRDKVGNHHHKNSTSPVRSGALASCHAISLHGNPGNDAPVEQALAPRKKELDDEE